MRRNQAEIFSCVLCRSHYSLNDIREGRYYPSTGVCQNCYKSGQKLSIEVWCFGKKDKRLGYNPDAIECKQECPDRIICPVYISEMEERNKMSKHSKDKENKKKKGRREEDEDEDDDDVETEEEEEEEDSDEEEDEDGEDDEDSEDESEEEDEDEDEEDEEEDEEPRKKKKSKKVKDEDEDEEEEEEDEDEEEEEERPKKKKKGKKAKKVRDEEDEDEEEEEEEEEPRRKRGKKSKREKKMKGKKDKKEKDKKEKKAKAVEKDSKASSDGFPFQEASVIGQAMRLAMKGTTEDKLRSFVKKLKGNPDLVMRTLRKGEVHGGKTTWDLDEGKGGHLKVLKLKSKKK